jgi:hypothetical protein
MKRYVDCCQNKPDEVPNIRNMVVVAIVKPYIIILREKWDTWRQVNTQKDIKKIRENADLVATQQAQDQGMRTPTGADLGKETLENELFEVLMKIKINKDDKLDIYKSKEPSL